MLRKLKKFFTKKRIIWAVIILVVLFGGYKLFFGKKTQEELLTVTSGDFLQQVSASGKIEPKDNLDLSFADLGQVSSVLVKVGDQVIQGKLLASQNTSELQAQFVQMQAGVDLQKAKLDQLLAGAGPEDIQTAQRSVDSAKQTLDNSYDSAKTALNSATTSLSNASTTVAYIQRTYFTSNDQPSFAVQDNKKIIENNALDAKVIADDVKIDTDHAAIDAALLKVIVDVNSTYDSLVMVRQQTDKDTYASQVSLTDKTSLDTQKTNMSAALNNITSAKSSIASYANALSLAQDQLNLKKAPVRESDIAVYRAQVKQAEGSLQGVAAQLNKKRIYSPITGLVTAVNAKVGKVFSSNDIAVSVISNSNFQVESFVPEINISFLKVGQEADVTLDAYGSSVIFPAKVILIDPAETIKDGVSTYKVTLEFITNDDRIKTGMTGNVLVTTDKKSNVISIPQGLVILNGDKKVVKLKQGQEVIEKEVETGAIASNGNIEVTSGLSDGDIVVVTEK